MEKLNPDLFGSFQLEPMTVPLADGSSKEISYIIREIHYPVNSSNTQVGMRFLPYVERPGVDQDLDSPRCDKDSSGNYVGEDCYPLNSQGVTANGTKVLGSDAIDSAFYAELETFRSDLDAPQTAVNFSPIFAPVSYSHPDYSVLPVGQLSSSYKPEMSFGHTGAYYGSGITANSPFGLHDNKWMWDGDNEYSTQPANIYMVGIKGVNPKILNLNLYVTLRLLNMDGVQFPSNYKKDYMFDVNLKNVFAHYRGWIDRSWVNLELSGRSASECESDSDLPGCQPFFNYLTDAEVFATYCAEHITHVMNVGLNLPQNERGYREVFGDAAGIKLFQLAKNLWRDKFGHEMPVVPYFDPLYKRDGVQSEPAQVEEVGLGLAWKPVTNAELAANFIETYANWKDVGSAISGAVLLGFKDELVDRTGLSAEHFVGYVHPIIAKMIVFDILKYSQESQLSSPDDVQGKAAIYINYFAQAVSVAMQQQGMSEAEIGPIVMPILDVVSSVVEDVLEDYTPVILEYANGSEMSLQELESVAYDLFRQSIAVDIEKAKSAPVTHDLMELARSAVNDEEGVSYDKKVQYYSPPATLHRVATGLYPGNPNLIVKTLGTAVPAKQLDYVTNQRGEPANYTEVGVKSDFTAEYIEIK
tara:strand:- start:108391 stop:110316 length:1926 start_codon:yes stop_codon:yes gene_type:complete